MYAQALYSGGWRMSAREVLSDAAGASAFVEMLAQVAKDSAWKDDTLLVAWREPFVAQFDERTAELASEEVDQAKLTAKSLAEKMRDAGHVTPLRVVGVS